MKRKREHESVLLTSAALGALSGLRGLAGPALLSRELAEGRDDPSSGLARLLSSDAASRVLALLASGEILADGTRFGPGRSSPIPLVGRAIMGSLTAAAYASARRGSVALPAIVGGAAALAAAFGAHHLRRLAVDRFAVSDRLVEMAEDAVVVGAGRGIGRAMRR
jgi:uncharacterized membrane protein